jgi:hypothetical protein
LSAAFSGCAASGCNSQRRQSRAPQGKIGH